MAPPTHPPESLANSSKAWIVSGLMAAIVLIGTTGCSSFFMPVCQANNDCSSSGGGGGTGTSSSYAYVANATLGTLVGFPVPTAGFKTLTGSSYNIGTPPIALAATPKGTFLYVALDSGDVFLYTIGSNGVLTLGNAGSPVASTLNGTGMSMTVDPTGNWLFMVSNSIDALLEYQINASTGVLTQVGQTSGIPLNAGSPTQICVTPNDQYVYVGLGIGGTDGFAFNSSTGALANQIHVAPLGVASDNAIAADNNSAYLFIGEAGKGIRAFTIGTGGVPKEISGSPFASQLGPQSIVVDPTNTFVYVANKTANVITGYTLGTGGTLTPLSSSPFSTGSQPIAMALDSTGKYLFVVNSGGSPDMQVFSFDATTAGKLDSVTSVATGADPAGAVALSVVP
ncbi:MAG TPA: beta-propeller fold lactonase family protein [Acidobacteriaceae bacterium]|nr:beta-propeller fold lactonase family protein [Acidobacteriaceae bacterium]